MTMQDINSARPAYLSWTLFRDYHYAVFNKAGELVLILVTNKGELNSFWVAKPDTRKHSIVYENHEIKARIMMGQYSRECTDLLDILKQQQPSGEYSFSVVDASGKRLYSFNIWI